MIFVQQQYLIAIVLLIGLRRCHLIPFAHGTKVRLIFSHQQYLITLLSIGFFFAMKGKSIIFLSQAVSHRNGCFTVVEHGYRRDQQHTPFAH